jgi:hypothetical protein
MLSRSRADTAEPVPRARGSAAMLEKAVISTGNHALRGAVNWGAEKNRIVTCAELGTEKSDPHKTRKTQKRINILHKDLEPISFLCLRLPRRKLKCFLTGWILVVNFGPDLSRLGPGYFVRDGVRNTRVVKTLQPQCTAFAPAAGPVVVLVAAPGKMKWCAALRAFFHNG